MIKIYVNGMVVGKFLKETLLELLFTKEIYKWKN